MAGYSGRALSQKLGIKPGFRMAVIAAPRAYWDVVQPLPTQVQLEDAQAQHLDLIHLFVTQRAELAESLPRLRRQIVANGMIWVSWPKRTAQVPTDVTEDVIRALALPLGLVDTKVCAIDATWSGLKLVIPLHARPDHQQ